MLKPRYLIFLSVIILSVSWFSSLGTWKRFKANNLKTTENSYILPKADFTELKSKAGEAKNFTRERSFNDQICFLIDMSLPTWQNRFFIYDLKKDTIQNTGLVTHGRCNQQWLDGRKYSNEPGCGCTSLGKYKIGYSYNGKFGLAYKLYGLDKTNSNALKRYVVLHAHECVPEMESEDEICQSDGCPTVAPGYLLQLKSIINKSSKPVLLWIYE